MDRRSAETSWPLPPSPHPAQAWSDDTGERSVPGRVAPGPESDVVSDPAALRPRTEVVPQLVAPRARSEVVPDPSLLSSTGARPRSACVRPVPLQDRQQSRGSCGLVPRKCVARPRHASCSRVFGTRSVDIASGRSTPAPGARPSLTPVLRARSSHSRSRSAACPTAALMLPQKGRWNAVRVRISWLRPNQCTNARLDGRVGAWSMMWGVERGR